MEKDFAVRGGLRFAALPCYNGRNRKTTIHRKEEPHMDIKAKVDEIVRKIKADDGLGKRFLKEPVKTLEDLLGVDLPDEQLKALVENVKKKLQSGEVAEKVGPAADTVADTLSGVAGKLKLDKVADKLEDAVGGLLGKK